MNKIRLFLIVLALLNLFSCGENSQEQTTADLSMMNEEKSVVAIRDQNVAGIIRNSVFEVDQAVLENGNLTLRQGEDFFADAAITVVFFGEDDFENKSFSITETMEFSKPHIWLKVKKDGQDIPDMITLMDGYEMQLNFGEKENLGIPFSMKFVSSDNETDIEGKFFATFKDIEVVDGEIDLNSDSFDTLDHLAREYINEKYGEINILNQFGTSTASYGKDYPKNGFVGYETDNEELQLIKLQLAKDENGWRVANELNDNQIHNAHPVHRIVDGNLRTVEGQKVEIIAARELENYLNDQGLIDSVRSVEIHCNLTKVADKASCRSSYSLKTDGQNECHHSNYLLSNNGESWKYDKEILDTQSVDYNTGELITKKPLSSYCSV